MRRYRKWVLGLGLMAAPSMLAPAAASAGPLEFLGLAPSAGTQDASTPSNQEMANRIAQTLRSAQLLGSNISIIYGGGICTLTGQVVDEHQRARASEWAASVPGVTSVDNRLTVIGPEGAEQPTEQPTRQVTTADHAVPNATPTAAGTTDLPTGQIIQTAAMTAAPVDAPAPSGGIDGTALAAYTAEPAPPQPDARAGNQQVAEQIGASLRRARLGDQPITVRFAGGTVILEGSVPTPQHKARAGQAAGNVAGVANVENRLSVTAMPATSRTGGIGTGGIAPVNFQDPGADPSPLGLQGPMLAQNGVEDPGAGFGAPGMVPGMVPGMAPGMVPGMVPGMQPDFGAFGGQGFGAPPQFGVPGPGANPAIFDNPSFPPYAWPAQAQFPNAAAIQYPKQYDASAWPYIGPFYPYPQVPLGWRKVTLEWDDGHWMLDFDSKTDRWWWFVDPKNW